MATHGASILPKSQWKSPKSLEFSRVVKQKKTSTMIAVTRKTGKHLMTRKRRKTPKFCRKTLKKSSFIVLWYKYDVCNHIFNDIKCPAFDF